MPRHRRKNPAQDHRPNRLEPEIEPEVVDQGRLKEARQEDAAVSGPSELTEPIVTALANLPTEQVGGKKGNVFINNLNVIVSPLRELLDPVHKVCIEPFQSHYHERYRKPFKHHASKVLIFDLFLLTVAGALAVAGFFLYFILPIFPQPRIISLQAISPTELVSGKLANFTVSYVNDSDQPLANASLDIRLPKGFAPAVEETSGGDAGNGSGSPSEASTGQAEAGLTAIGPAGQGLQVGDEYVYRVSLGNIAPHGRGDAGLRGRLYAPVGSRQTMTATMTFWKAGDTGPRQMSQHLSWLVEDTTLQLALRPEDQIVRGRQVAISLPYSNLDERPVQAVLRLTAPDDFVMTGSTPARSGANEWELGRLDAGQKGAVTVYGYFRSGTAKPAVPSFTVSAYLLENGQRYLVQELRQSIEALAGGFEVNQELVSPAGASAISAGEQVSLTIRYRNAGDQPIKNVKISLLADQGLLEMGPSLQWDGQTIPDLASLAPGTSGALTVDLRIKPELDLRLFGGSQRPSLNLKTEAQYFLADALTRPILAETSSLELPINTSLTLKAAAFYWTKDGDQVGSGPLPPQVGQTTKFRVFVQVGNSLNQLDEAVFEAFLPAEVEWGGRYSVTAGRPPAFLPAQRRLVWNIDSLPAGGNAADQNGQAGASFELAMTPKDNLTSPILLTDLKLCGRDSSTGVKLCAQADPVSTEVKYGP